jgi:hypothetical protein
VNWFKRESEKRMSERKLYGILAEFSEPSLLLEASRSIRDRDYIDFDTYTPFPIEGLDEAIGFPKNGVPFIALVGGGVGGGLGFLMQWFGYTVEYPINVAGRPNFSWPSFIPVTFEMTILSAALCGVVAMFFLNGLPEPYHPLFDAESFERASCDLFFICVRETDSRFDPDKTKALLIDLGAEKVSEVYSDAE